MATSSPRKTGRLKAVRGPTVSFTPHTDHCETPAELLELTTKLREEDKNVILAADLFSGAGGLSLGLEQAGMKVVLSADHDPRALETHSHHFGGMAVKWDLSDPSRVEEIASLMEENKIEVLAGGPPCQPFSLAGRPIIKSLVRQGRREPHDTRRDLWRSFLEVARLAEPQAVIMENVPAMALDREMFILRSMVLELEMLGYHVHTRVLEAWRYGVPQLRNRLFLVAVKGGTIFEWGEESARKVTLANAISDLPAVEGGWRPQGWKDGWTEYGGPTTSYQRRMRKGVEEPDRNRIFDHITRPVRDDDKEAFELLDSQTSYADLPARLKRYRDDIFQDKYKRLAGDDVSRTITAHIAKDGYWYIHPEQNRTLTIREAARVQSFPDWFRFAGAPSVAFRQIGNAVPPLLGEAVGRAVLESLSSPVSVRPTREEVSHALIEWFGARSTTSSPWLHAKSNWQTILGEVLLGKTAPLVANSLWPLIARVETAEMLSRHKETVREALSWVGREHRVLEAEAVAAAVGSNVNLTDEEVDDLVRARLIGPAVGDVARLAKHSGEEPVIVTSGALRVAARFEANPLGQTNKNTDGRLAIASLIGFGPDARTAQLALLELAEDVCLPTDPKCEECPLRKWCLSAPSFIAQRSRDSARLG